MATRNVGAVLGDLKNRIGAIATALVSRDGLVVHAEMPAASYADTFAVMCATILGAAGTANSELGQAPPDRIVVEGPGSRLILVGAGRKTFLVAVVDESTEPRAAIDEVARFADLLATN
jgi:hypothetical protein